MTRLIIFDFDGTIGNTRQNIVDTFHLTMRERGLELRSDDECASTIGLTLHNSFLSLYPSMSDAEAEECVAHYRRIFYENIEELTPLLFDGVKEALARLHAMDLKLTIASSRSSPSLLLFLKNMGISQYFSYVIGADNVPHHKPHPEPVLQTLRECGFEPSDALVVGDMPVDMLMARNASVRCVGVTWGNATRKELQESQANYLIDHISELFEYL